MCNSKFNDILNESAEKIVSDTLVGMPLKNTRGILEQAVTDINKRKKRKWDEGKNKYHLILTEFIDEMARILTLGEKNHPKEPDGTPSWQLVEPEAYIDALYRHMHAIRMGEENDKDMGTRHAVHVAVNAMFIDYFIRKGYNAKSND